MNGKKENLRKFGNNSLFLKKNGESTNTMFMGCNYSPDLSPIVLCWSKLKTDLRARAARTREALEPAGDEALPTITTTDARHWFAHCGHHTAPN